eukprot:GHVR01172093.1.p1 GENE.GHVR01172093.1~~GHVR01172093.1.p1  ORF type:complete len:250 (+),score=100.26 GHVR01172093.1:100-750(+)
MPKYLYYGNIYTIQNTLGKIVNTHTPTEKHTDAYTELQIQRHKNICKEEEIISIKNYNYNEFIEYLIVSQHDIIFENNNIYIVDIIGFFRNINILNFIQKSLNLNIVNIIKYYDNNNILHEYKLNNESVKILTIIDNINIGRIDLNMRGGLLHLLLSNKNIFKYNLLDYININNNNNGNINCVYIKQIHTHTQIDEYDPLQHTHIKKAITEIFLKK